MKIFNDINFFQKLVRNNKKYEIKTSIIEYENWNIVNVLSAENDVIKFDFLNRGASGGINENWISEKVILDIHLHEILEFKEYDSKGFTEENIKKLFTPPKNY